MRNRHAQALKEADDIPDVEIYSDRKMQVSHMDGNKNDQNGLPQLNQTEDDEDASFCQIQELPSLRCSVIDGPGGEPNSGVARAMDKVDWNDLLVRESIPDDYGTIRATDTNRA